LWMPRCPGLPVPDAGNGVVVARAPHHHVGVSVWDWAGNGAGDPDVVMACAGDVPAQEALAAVTLLRWYVPDIRIRFVNVVDLMVLLPHSEHPHGLHERDFDALFTADRPVIFAFHGDPALICTLTCRRRNHDNIHVRGIAEPGCGATPFDGAVLHQLDRYTLALDAIRHIPRFTGEVEVATERHRASIEEHHRYLGEHGEDMPQVRNWCWDSPP
jgi:xylulose-5-phosphate/fructose-6-phosphate phosphoketolase